MSVGVSFGQKLMHDIVPLLLLPAAKELGDEKKEGKIEPGRCDRIVGVVDLRGFFLVQWTLYECVFLVLR